MGFFSFGKKKKNDTKTAPPAVPAKSHLRRPSNLVNSASASSSLSAATSSGSSSGSPPQPRRTQTFSGAPTTNNQRLSFSPDTHLHPVPRIPGSHSHASSSTSLGAPIAPYANRDLQKKGSTNTLNSIKSTASKRGAHEAPRINPELAALGLAKPRASSYHASQVRNIWVTSASDAGHGNSKYYSTGSPGVMNRGSSYFGQAQAQHPQQSDEQFKIYAKKYDTAIAKAHTLAREYHHLPPAKRDRPRFEQIGRSFAAAAQLSREQWSYRCKLEKERLEALLDQGQLAPQDEAELSTHRIAGARATEGWQYASMLADAWGIKDEVEPLEDMPVLKPVYPTARSSSYYSDRNAGPSYLHPGYSQANYTAYSSPGPTRRDRIDSNASASPSLADSQHYAHSTSSHTHSGLSHSLNHSQSHHTLSKSSYLPSPLKSNGGIVEETVTRAPIVLTKGRKYRERGSSLASVPVTVS